MKIALEKIPNASSFILSTIPIIFRIVEENSLIFENQGISEEPVAVSRSSPNKRGNLRWTFRRKLPRADIHLRRDDALLRERVTDFAVAGFIDATEPRFSVS